MRVSFFKIISFAAGLRQLSMPRTSRRKSQLHGARACRRSSMQTSDSSCTSDDEYRMDADDEESNFKEKILLTDIGDLAEMCKTKCDTKYLSTLLYMSLRFFNINGKIPTII